MGRSVRPARCPIGCNSSYSDHRRRTCQVLSESAQPDCNRTVPRTTTTPGAARLRPVPCKRNPAPRGAQGGERDAASVRPDVHPPRCGPRRPGCPGHLCSLWLPADPNGDVWFHFQPTRRARRPRLPSARRRGARRRAVAPSRSRSDRRLQIYRRRPRRAAVASTLTSAAGGCYLRRAIPSSSRSSVDDPTILLRQRARSTTAARPSAWSQAVAAGASSTTIR